MERLAIVTVNQKQDKITEMLGKLRLIKIHECKGVCNAIYDIPIANVYFVTGFTPAIHFLQDRFGSGWLVSKDGPDRRRFDIWQDMVDKYHCVKDTQRTES